MISNLAEYGNTSAASIPLALDESVRAGTVKKGDVVCPRPWSEDRAWCRVWNHLCGIHFGSEWCGLLSKKRLEHDSSGIGCTGI